MKSDLTEKIALPEKVSAKVEGSTLEVTGKKGTNTRLFHHQKIKVEIKDQAVVFSCKGATKREKTMIKTYRAHALNMVKGVQEPHVYELKICSGHFPMNVALKGDTLSVKNFLGEKTPRVLTIPNTVKAKVDGDKITVESVNIEAAGQCAASMEQLTRITNKDRRIFQDGLYITSKAGKPIP